MTEKVLMIIAPEKFRDEELNHPREIFTAAGLEVTVASTKKGEAAGMLGHRENVTHDLGDVAGGVYDAVVIVGGAGSPAHLWDNKTVHEIARRHFEAGKIVAAICLSGAVLARAGLLKGVPATVWKSPESMAVYSECGVNFQDKPVVRSGKIITGQGPSAARDFGREVLRAVQEG
ncbi:MAG: DJ-1/PfpI family protein [Candidatus Nitrospinota bacterium M3_3B_026]